MEDKITLRDVEVVFANLTDEGFGKSITVNATDNDVKKAITKWVETNKIGKGDKAGKPNFKEYEGKYQYAFKINDYTRFAGLNGLSETDLGFGARISLVANSFAYDNKFGKGISGSLSAVLVEKRASTSADGDLADLLGGTEAKDEIAPIPENEEINLSDIPF
jgi:hypothetical protein